MEPLEEEWSEREKVGGASSLEPPPLDRPVTQPPAWREDPFVTGGGGGGSGAIEGRGGAPGGAAAREEGSTGAPRPRRLLSSPETPTWENGGGGTASPATTEDHRALHMGPTLPVPGRPLPSRSAAESAVKEATGRPGEAGGPARPPPNSVAAGATCERTADHGAGEERSKHGLDEDEDEDVDVPDSIQQLFRDADSLLQDALASPAPTKSRSNGRVGLDSTFCDDYIRPSRQLGLRSREEGEDDNCGRSQEEKKAEDAGTAGEKMLAAAAGEIVERAEWDGSERGLIEHKRSAAAPVRNEEGTRLLAETKEADDPSEKERAASEASALAELEGLETDCLERQNTTTVNVQEEKGARLLEEVEERAAAAKDETTADLERPEDERERAVLAARVEEGARLFAVLCRDTLPCDAVYLAHVVAVVVVSGRRRCRRRLRRSGVELMSQRGAF